MQNEDDLRGLAKVMEFMRAISILFVVINIYWFCYQSIQEWGINIGVVDRILLGFQRTPIKENDIDDIIRRFSDPSCDANNSFKEQSFFVPVDTIRENGYNLSYKKYHEVEREVVEYEEPEVIMNRMEQRQAKITKAFEAFKKMMEE